MKKFFRLLTAILVCITAVPAAGGEIPPSDAALRAGLSPYNWIIREDALASAVGGASLNVQFSGTRKVTLRVDTSALASQAPSTFPRVAWTVNGGSLRTHQLTAGQTALVLADDTAEPVIDLFIQGISPWEDRWTGTMPPNSLRIVGFTVEDGGRAVAIPQPEGVWLNIGDSILAGDGAAYAEGQGRPKRDEWVASDDARASYGWLLARHFGYREARLAFGGYNWGGGLAKVPDLVSVLRERLCAPAPAVVLVNLGTNGRPKDEQVLDALQELRRRCGPATKILVMIPVSGAARAEVTRAFKTWQTGSPDENAHLIDLGKIPFATADKIHPTAEGHRAIFEAALPEMKKALNQNPDSAGTSAAGGTPLESPVPLPRKPKTAKPNILVIVTDQQFAEVMSCRMGRAWLHTPALDALAERGTVFTRAYCVFPLCGPSRNSMFTGLYPQHVRWRPYHDKPSVYLGRYLSDAGYETAYCGKSELRGKEIELHGFQSILAPMGGSTRLEAMQNGGWDPWAAREAVKFIAQPREKPFLLVASFLNPHNICEWSRRLAGHAGELDCGEIGDPPPLDKLPPAPANLAPQAGEPDSLTQVRRSYQANPLFPVGGFTAEHWRKHRWGYYRMVGLVDREIGRLLSALRTAGVEEETLVVFTSDHGECAGAHGWNQKSVPYDESTRVPFLVSWKGKTRTGTSDKLINTGIDLVPTVLAAAGVPLPETFPGLSALDLSLGKPVANWRDQVVSQMSMSQGSEVDGAKPTLKWWMLRTERYKYCVFSAGERRESLVDMQEDPGEARNLAADATYHAVLLEHRERLRRYGKEHQDRGVDLILAGLAQPVPVSKQPPPAESPRPR